VIRTGRRPAATRPVGTPAAPVARRRRAGRVVAAAAALLVAGTAAVTATGLGLGGDDRPAARGGGLPPATAKVTRQNLIDTQTESGRLAYGGERTVTARLAGTLTALPVTGATVGRGKTLYRVDDRPVVLLYGSLPAYRTLAPGTKGKDVRQFEKNLWALGYRGFTVDREFTADTAAAVKDWQGDLGLTKTGTVEPGRVVYAPNAVRVSARKAAAGDALRPGAAVLTCTGRTRVITVELGLDDERLARQGTPVTVRLPSGTTVSGKVSGARTVIDTGGDENSDPTTKIKVTIAVGRVTALAGLDQASVDVDFAASERSNVLTVPVGALLALSEGGYGVQVVTGATTRIVAVETGLFAAGRVEVSGGGLTEGMTVGVPS
jgi:peptidoglycan hydrolase-like protein with peptidoglycan-binding domain